MSNVNLLDLPDEILLLILHKLTIIDMLYSLVNVNERFDRLVLNPSNISDLNLKNHSLVHYQSTSMKQVCAEIRDKVLPRIHDQIIRLSVQSIHLQQKFFTIDYPQLRSLSLAVTRDILSDNLTGKVLQRKMLKLYN